MPVEDIDIAAVRRFVEAAGRDPANAYGPQFCARHVAVVSDYALALADRLGADRRIVEASALLHDIAAMQDVRTLARHAEIGGAIARRFLLQHGTSAATAEAVAQSIALHSSPVPVENHAAEAVCLSHADAMAQIAQPAYFLFVGFRVRNLGFAEGRAWLQTFLTKQWSALLPEAKALVAPEYDRATAILAG